ncbi:protein FAR1-RELATED SEQUENCE 4-like [Tripterygium wilfordii]|uniref:protein FAR1-RELATED SEQUENCE 4-like n=1 Tax=Tripterygium wilfordii TaxID=458696 RepID=UPI0018F8568E|nr:protein FAR1-RELATED SEQUENCE 4-like [Tripterygium wilfordii]
MKLKTDDDWMVRVVCGVHNHSAALYMKGHSYVGKLSTVENEILVDMSKNLVKPRNILYTLKNRDPNNVSTIKTIYNACQKFRTTEKAGKSQIQQLMSFLHQYEYVFFNRSNAQTNELEELFFTHPGSIELLRAFPHVLLMDATNKTNRFRMPLFEIVGVTSTKMTFCVGFVFLQSEKVDNYTWALNCLQSTMDESTFPRVIVTDRDLTLMRSCAQVFPESMKLLCRWHIDRAVISHCKKSFRDKESWDSFYST